MDTPQCGIGDLYIKFGSYAGVYRIVDIGSSNNGESYWVKGKQIMHKNGRLFKKPSSVIRKSYVYEDDPLLTLDHLQELFL